VRHAKRLCGVELQNEQGESQGERHAAPFRQHVGSPDHHGDHDGAHRQQLHIEQDESRPRTDNAGKADQSDVLFLDGLLSNRMQAKGITSVERERQAECKYYSPT
jgi:hypothetical protein